MKKRLIVLLVLLPLIAKAQVGIISTVAGNGGAGISGDGGPASSASIGANGGIAFDHFGNYYFAAGFQVRKVSNAGIITTVAGTGSAGYSGDGGPATNAKLNGPVFIAFDAANNLYISEVQNNTVRKVNAISGIISTFVGTGTAGYSGDGGPATAAKVNAVYGICFDAGDNFYLADYLNYRIRKVNTSGIITTYAGNGTGGYSGDGGAATDAEMFHVYGICSDVFGNIYTSDGARVRKVNSATGIISTVAGRGLSTTGGDGGPATAAGINPQSLFVTQLGDIYICEMGNNDVRKVNAFGVISKVAGNGSLGYSGDGGDATLATLSVPRGITVDSCGNLLICDNSNDRIRKVTYNPPPCSHLGIAEINNENFPEFFPNPVHNELIITSQANDKTLKIYNPIGKLVLQRELQKPKETVSIAQLPNGLYLVKLTDADGNSTTTRIIKQ
jgi:trimeric autotransporter adhesin